ncbi:DUF3489 domain-containing protein [Rhodospirillaceae bacterium SYSU D60014]|uniref:DUF3489 domain-containing protein n=1 Tax=Virgifigura deserti TaxID=2268457 RepID=UPI000E663E57
MPKLTDTQLVILSAAAQRADGSVLPLPPSLKLRGGAVTSVLKSLLKSGLVAEQPGAPDVAAWREAENGRRVTLVITDAGLQAIGIDSKPGVEKPEPAKTPDLKRPAQKPAQNTATPKRPAAAAMSESRPGTKQSLLIDLLRQKSGASLAEIVTATGWQPHSVRGAISGTLKKKLGLAVASETVAGRGRVYRIVAGR